MVITDMLKKFRGYYHFIKKEQKHREAFGVHPIRAVLVETTDEARGRRLMDLAAHPLLCGAANRAGLFCLSISPIFTDPTNGSPLPRLLAQPSLIFDPIWALPDRTLHALGDPENSQPSARICYSSPTHQPVPTIMAQPLKFPSGSSPRHGKSWRRQDIKTENRQSCDTARKMI